MSRKIKKNYISLTTKERADLKQLSKRKLISQNAIKQIRALLLFDRGETMTEVMEFLGLSPQTLLKWRKAFENDRMDSLLVDKNKKKIIEEIPDEDDEIEDDDETEESDDSSESE